MDYKVNIYSEVSVGDNTSRTQSFSRGEVSVGEGWVESEPLFSKITKNESMAITADTDVDIPDDTRISLTLPDVPRTTKITVHRKNSIAHASKAPLITDELKQEMSGILSRQNSAWSRQNSHNSDQM